MTRHLNFDPAREPLPPDDELWGSDGLPNAPDAENSASASETLTPSDDALDATLRALAREHYHVRDDRASRASAPHEQLASVPRDAMWAAISARRANTGQETRPATRAEHEMIVRALTPRQSRRLWPALAALAATLIVGVVIGRGLTERSDDNLDAAPDAASIAAMDDRRADNDTLGLPVMLATLTTQHFASTEALLVTARQGLSGTATDASIATWARDLLLSTRLLLDTEALHDLRTRQLLQDLELTLALIVQAQSSGRAADAQSVRDDLDAGDLLLRVRGAAMPTVNAPDDTRGMSE